MKHEERIELSPPCGNEVFGCRKRFARHEWVRELRACKACVRAAARKWWVQPGDLMMVLAAYRAAAAGLNGAVPTGAQVWAILSKAGVKKEIPIPEPATHAPMERCLPGGDRVAA